MLTENQLIAPCGMNCGICSAHLRKDRQCPGCHGEGPDIPAYCLKCIIRNCETIKENQSGFCFECEKYPCRRLKQLDKRYITKYKMSMIENLENIKGIGLDAFVDNEKERWKCIRCGGVINVHRGRCLQCGP